MTATALLLAGTALAYATSQGPDAEQDTPFLASTKGTGAIVVGLVAMVLFVGFSAYRSFRARYQTRAEASKAAGDVELGDAKSPPSTQQPSEVGSPDVDALLIRKQLSKASVQTVSTAVGSDL